MYLEWLYYCYRGYSEAKAFDIVAERNLTFLSKSSEFSNAPLLEKGEDGKYRLTEEYIEVYLDWLAF